MSGVFGALVDAGASHCWLVTANVSLAALLCAWLLRYRHLYLRSREERENYRELIGNLSEGIYRSSLEGQLVRVNRALAELNGYEGEETLLAGVRDIPGEWYVEPGRSETFRALLRRDGRVKDFVSEVYRHKTRERIWITESARVVHDNKSGKALFYEGSVREITETVKRLQLEEMFQKLTTQLPGSLFQLVRHNDGAFSIPYVSSSFRGLAGLGEQDPFPAPVALLKRIHASDRERFSESLRQSRKTMRPWDCEFRAVDGDGVETWLRATASPEAIEDGIIWHGYLANISIRKRHEMKIEKLAFFDPLTELPNRRMFLDRIARAADGCAKKGGHGALLFVDLDNFKTLNDTMGHDVGDAFLVQVARRLTGCVRSNDTVARIGGDEFVIVLERLGDDNAVATRNAILIANKMLAALRDEFDLGNFLHRSSASLGVVVFDGTQTKPDAILKNADMAMYEAKAAGRNGMALFDPTHLNREAERFRLVSQLREAIEKDHLSLEYQPQLDDAGTVYGAEALARWNHPDHGTLFPGAFVPIAEQYGLTEDLCAFVLEKAMATLAGWGRDPMTAQLAMSVNVSVPAINSESFVPLLKDLIARYRIDPTLLTLEATEHVMGKDHACVARRMKEIKATGVRLSLDDFGTGYSSLAFLKQLPFDEVKIDGSFVTDIEKSDGDRALVKTILAMARTLGLKSVAEHVETIQQEAFLRAFGCDYFQGWHYSPALVEEEFVAFVAERNPTSSIVAFPGAR